MLVAQERVAQGQTRPGALQICTTSSSAPASPWFPSRRRPTLPGGVLAWPGLNTPGPLRDFPGLKFMALIAGLSSLPPRNFRWLGRFSSPFQNNVITKRCEGQTIV